MHSRQAPWLAKQISRLKRFTAWIGEWWILRTVEVNSFDSEYRLSITYDLSDKSQLSMYMAGESYEYDVVRFLSKHLTSASTFVDVGAHIGKFAIPVAAAFPDVKVFAVEPWFENVSRLKAHARTNHVDIQVIEAAVTNRLNTRFTAVPGYSGWGHIDEDGEYSVDSITLDSFVTGPCVLKIDVEGEEERVMESGLALLREHRFSAISIEVRPDTSPNVRNILEQSGYTIHTPENSGRIQNLFASPSNVGESLDHEEPKSQ